VFLKAQKWPLIKGVRKMRKKDGEAEGEDCADATAPVREMQGITQLREPDPESLEDQKIYKLMENV
jgi:hypothetical protein